MATMRFQGAPLLAALAVLGLGRVGTADPQGDRKLDEARAHVKTGTQFYDENNFRAALVEFQRAYELAPSYKILFNIGQVEMQLDDSAGALKALTRYLREGGPDVSAERTIEVNTDLERLKGRVGYVTVQTAAGNEVAVDDVAVGFAPLPEPLAVNVGQHRVTVRPVGRDPQTRVVDVAGRQQITVVLANDQAVAAPANPIAAPPAKVAEPRGPLPEYLTWAAAGGFAITSTVFGLAARSDADQLATLRGSYPVTAAALEAQRAKTAKAALFSDGFAAAALVTGGVALYLTLTRPRGGAHAPKERQVNLEIGPTGFAVAGTF